MGYLKNCAGAIMSLCVIGLSSPAFSGAGELSFVEKSSLRFERMDMNQDRRVTWDEYEAFMDALTVRQFSSQNLYSSFTEYAAAVRVVASARFEALDLDGDHNLSWDEMKLGRKGQGQTSDRRS